MIAYERNIAKSSYEDPEFCRRQIEVYVALQECLAENERLSRRELRTASIKILAKGIVGYLLFLFALFTLGRLV